LVTEFSQAAVFLTIYIAEAHAVDQWPMGNHVVIKQHKTLVKRLDAAYDYRAMLQKKGLSIGAIAVDGIDNLFMETFACHPERYFILHHGKLVVKPQPKKAMYKVSSIREYLLNHRS